jgi:hypothetical protein
MAVRIAALAAVARNVLVMHRRPLVGCLLGATLAFACGQSASPVSETPPDPDASVGPTTDAGGPQTGASDGGDTGGGAVSADADVPLDLANVTPGQWAWFDFPNTVCRDGSPAGFALNVSPSGLEKVMFYFEGGGACFNALTCAANASNVLHKEGSGVAFARDNPANPFADYTHVFVPYCTGDVHAGNHPNATVVGVATKQQFVGYTNTEYFLKKIAATYPALQRLVMIGPSAGGFGAAMNYGQALRIFPSIPVNLVDDSGPLMSNPPLAECLQGQWKTLWGFDKTIIAECGADCVGQANYLHLVGKHWASTSKYGMGLVSATGDETIRFFFGFGANNCSIPSTPSQATYVAGLEAIETELAANTNFGAYLYDATNHTMLENDRYYTLMTNGKTPAEWVRSIVESDAVSNIGP